MLAAIALALTVTIFPCEGLSEDECIPLDRPYEPGIEQDEGLYVWDLDSLTVEVTKPQGTFAREIWLGCEVYTELMKPYTRLADVRNRQGSGAAGQPQMMPHHRDGMGRYGLDFDLEYHRVIWGFALFDWHAGGPWSCKQSRERR